MTAPPETHGVTSSKRLNELTLLYQFSNTMLSTIRLNKLTHLILTALTTPSSRLFERAFLLLRNEKSEVLQGMLGVARHDDDSLQIIGDQDDLGSRWDISDEMMSLQRTSSFCTQVRMTRIEINVECPLIRKVIYERAMCSMKESSCDTCLACNFFKLLGVNTFAAVPLVTRDKAFGIIVVDNPESGNPISRDHIHFLQLFANQAGMAVENSMLYNRIEDAHSSLKDARERLVHGERLAAIGEMAANLAHELKNPLITIGGFAGRLVKQLAPESREHHYADTIVKEVVRLEAMLADILAFSRKPTICFSACDLGDILRDCIESCVTTFEDHGICLQQEIADRPLPLLGDAHQLKQVFLNLMLNSCDVMENGGKLLIATQISSSDNLSVVVKIQDTGGGIPVELLSQIFNPFFTTKRHGTGLGLAIANRILINHYGNIEAENEGGGALFRVRLPLADHTIPLEGAVAQLGERCVRNA